MENDNSVKVFFESEGYIEFKPNEKCSTVVLYMVYSRWCYDNAIKPSVTATFTQYLSDNEADFSDNRLHHEIYLSDARKVAPEKWKTVIRHPIKRKEA